MNSTNLKSLINATFILMLFIGTAQGATITVNAPDGADDRFDGLCSITEAIKSANLNSTSSECVTGSGTDTIVLSNDIVLNQVIVDDGSSNSFAEGRTGTPLITSSIIIQGNGYRIMRDPSFTCSLNDIEDANEFRILFNDRTGVLALQNLSIENGCSDGVRSDSPATYGAGLLNNGQLSLSKTSFINNKARVAGAGLASRYGDISTISNSSFIENSSVGVGAGIYTGGNIDIIENTTFYANFSGHNGGAIYIANDPFDYVRATINTIRNSSFHNNSAETEGGAIYAFGTLANLTNSLFSNNVSHNAFGAGSTDPFSNDSQDSDCQTYDSTAIINGSNNISHYGNSKSNCPGLINPRLDASSSAAIISDNGGSTMTVAMIGYNNAVDKAINGTLNGQRELGVVGVRDIGAFESRYPELCVISSGQNIQTNGFTATVSTASELLAAMVCSKFNGNLTDTIKLANSITLNSAYETASTANGSTATPSISTPVIIDGQGFTLSRNNSLSCNLNNINDISEFRLLFNEVGNTLTLKHIKLVNGCADGGMNQGLGGALYNAGDLSVINTEFVQNHAITGGGIYHASGRIADISQSTFFANSAQDSGGAIANSANINIIKNSTFTSNSAINKYGGGIYNLTSIFNILNSTFSSNSSGIRGDAIYNNDTITKISNNLFHNHGNDDCIDKGIKFLGFNNLSDNATGGCPGLIAATLTTSSIAGLAKNGGFTRSHALLAGSQAFNAAINGTSTDQRGFTVSDGTRDIGAIEDQSPVVTAPADIRIEATGLNTPVTQAMFGMATVNDPDQTGIIAAANNTATFNLGPHTVTWSATDNHGHTDSDTQLVTLEDTTPPTISLIGSSTILLKIGDSYNDAGATATDIIWGDVTASIVVTNPVNTSIAGTYTVNYRASDSIANISNATRTVKVRATIGGSVSGLTGTNTLKIYDGTNPFLFSSYLTLGNGQFTFINPVQSGDGYTVIITAQPASGNVTCSISNNTGSVTTSNITNISVVCFNPNEFYIGGMASGLINGNPVTLALGAQNLQISSNAAFVFPNPLLNGNTYEVTIDSLPNTPTQTCELLNPTGTITSNDVMDVEINCTTIDMVFDDGFE